MTIPTASAKYAHVALDTHNQSIEHLTELVRQVVGMAGCHGCGQVAFMRVDFLSDPPEALAKVGVRSFEAQGLT